MSGNKIFIDTNIAVYLLDGDTSLAEILNQKRLYLSFITQLELLGYQGLTRQQEQQIEYMLENCVIIDINNKIKQEVIKLRIKLFYLQLLLYPKPLKGLTLRAVPFSEFKG